MPLVQITWLLSSIVTLPWWSFWVLVGVLFTIEGISIVRGVERGEIMIGNGNGGIIHPAAMRADPNILRALQYAHDMAGNLAGIAIVGVTRDGNAVNLTSMPPDAIMMSLAVRQLFNSMRKLDDEIEKLSRDVQEKAAPVGQILRPPPIMGG